MQMKVALVHDYLREYGGAERVLEDLHEIFPDAPIYTAYYNPKGLGIHNDRIKKWDIRTSWMQKMPFANKLVSPFRLFASMMFESFDLSEYDVVISSDAIYFAKAVITKPETLHIAYIHTPPRYLYGYVTSYNYKKHWWTRIGGEIVNHSLRPLDFEVSQRPDILVANSKNIAQRIAKFYRRKAQIIYPGTDTFKFDIAKQTTSSEYFLSLGRLVRSKGIDIAIEAASKLKVPLKVAGGGPLFSEFKKLAGETVEVLGPVSDEERIKLLVNAKALIVLEEDPDFGITPVEAMAAGTPVIAVKRGGYLETVIDGETGTFIDNATVEDLIKALEKFDSKKFKAERLKKQAEKFSKLKFKEAIFKLISENKD